MRKLWAIIAASLIMIGTGCQSDPAATGGEPTADPSESTHAAADFPRTIEHAMGSTEIPEQPRRVVALDQAFVDATLSLETEVIAYTTYRDIDDGLPEHLGDTLQYAEKAEPVGTLEEPDLEKIAALEPDLILSAQVRHEALYEQLSKIAPTVFSETVGSVWKENLELTGEALGKEDLAEELLAAYTERATKIGEEIAAASDGTMPTISIVRFAGEPTIRLYVESSYSGVVLSDVGFPRPADQPTTDESIVVDISPENIPQLDADVIFVSTWGDPAATKEKKKVTANPLWNQLEGKQHTVDDVIWMSAVGLQGSHTILDDLAETFDVDPASDLR